MPISTRTFLVVGDRFVGFSVQDGVVTVSQFLRQLRSGLTTDGEPIVVRAGQGVSQDEWTNLCEHARRLGFSRRLTFQAPFLQLAGEAEVHKKVEINTLIANLRRTGDDLFSATLRVHNDNELLLDHQTGQHVQGMVAVEAARQMFLAVSERFYACRYPDTKYYYVIESMSTDFETFLFPLDAVVEFRTVTAEVDDPRRLSFEAEIGVHQAGRRASLTRVRYSAFECAVIEGKEHKRAARVVEYQVDTPAPALVGV